MNRMLEFGGTGVHLEYAGERAAAIVDFLFKRIPGEPAGPSPAVRLQLSEDPVSGAMMLSSDGDLRCVDPLPGAVASWLLHLTCLRLLRGGGNGLLLHAAAVRRGNRSLLLPGTSGSGKSTLTAFLTTRGFEYLTDELVYIAQASPGAQGFNAPLKIKQSGLRTFEHEVLPLMKAPAVVEGRFDVLVDPGGAYAATGDVPLSAIIFPRYQPGSQFHLLPMSPAQVALRLLPGVLNAASLPDHGFSEITRVANLAPGYELRFSSLAQIDEQLKLLHLITSGMDAGGTRMLATRRSERVAQPSGLGAR